VTTGQVFPSGAVATGQYSAANGVGAAAYGAGSTANAAYGTAIGQNATVVTGATNGTAIGQGSTVNASNGTAIGTGATVLSGATNATAIGQGSIADAPNTVSVGTTSNPRRITNVAPGVLSTDAVNVSQLKSSVNQLRRGIATTMAMGAAMTPTAPGKSTLQINGATYQGYYSTSINFAHRLKTQETPVYISGSVGYAEGGEVGARVGVAVEF
jgi:autotransporter adhesin